MSHLTRTPFHKPSPYDFPRPAHPLSPPETDITADSLQLPPMNLVSRDTGSYADIAMSAYTRIDASEHYHAPPSDTQTPNGRFRRPSNLAYHHSNSVLPNDSRAERRSAATKMLVMVIPPAAVSREHGTTLFLNTPTRAAQGVLMPLLPSLSGQLSAIAREFSFPSTTGIVVYLQMTDSGVQYTPRVSDESWPILWGSAFDEKQMMHAMGGLPISGRIEFDLDLRKARWFDMWVTTCRRELDNGLYAPTSALKHAREESRTTFTTAFTHEAPEESTADDISVTIQQKVPIIRRVPRKLSLLDRVDMSPLRPISRPLSQKAISSPRDDGPRIILSPVAQASVRTDDDEPQTAIQRVERKVESWRASSTFAKSPFVSTTGQTALDPTNMPNNLPLVDADANADGAQPFNLDDFTWSISSAGPRSADFELDSALYSDWDRVPSVHLDRRLEGSVCLTPTTVTSFGPPEYDIDSPVASLISRLPSPDIAARNIDDAPLTPSTATSWGPPSEWPSSPASSYRAPSVDIAARQLDSRPATPRTATSWGAPSEWPDSPVMISRPPSVDLAARQMGSRPVTPSTATSWGAPVEWLPSPATPFFVHTPGVGQMYFDNEDEEEALLRPGRVLRSYGAGDDEPWKHVWPYNGAAEETPKPSPWRHVWPYRRAAEPEAVICPMSAPSGPGYPRICLYPAVYPHFDLYPACEADDVQLWQHTWPYNTNAVKSSSTRPWVHVWPYQDAPGCENSDLTAPRNSFLPSPTGLSEDDDQRVKSTKPWNFVWPYHHDQDVNDVVPTIVTRLTPGYPSICLYPAVYPHFDLYPVKSGTSRVVDVRAEIKLPIPGIHAAAYLSSEIHSRNVVKPQENFQKALPVKLAMSYPFVEIYTPVYPHIVLYPAKYTSAQGQVPSSRFHKGGNTSPSLVKHKQDVRVKLERHYPVFDLYPAVYPASLYNIYPPVSVNYEHGTSLSIEASLSLKYPHFNIYPASYPSFDLYPSVYFNEFTISHKREKPAQITAVYATQSGRVSHPFNLNLADEKKAVEIPRQSSSSKPVIVVALKPTYPHIELYPPMYPHLCVYPTIQSPALGKTISIVCHSRYPNFDLYPAVYPYFDIYRSGKAATPEYWREPQSVRLDAKYPAFDIYPPAYPSFDIYNSGFTSDPTPLTTKLSVRLEAKYPAFDIYPAAYPHFQLYPAEQSLVQTASSHHHAKKTHELHDLVMSQNTSPEGNSSVLPSLTVPTLRQPRRTHEKLHNEVFPPVRFRASVSLAEVPEDVSPSSLLVPAGSPGMPTRLSEIRRTVSLGRPSRATPPEAPSGISRSGSLRQVPTLARGVAGPARRLSQVDELEATRNPTRGKNLVFEKARQWGAPGTEPQSEPSRLTMGDLSEFPMPPLPPVPGLPANPRSSMIKKLDRSKFPFR
ncbi:hypothetical protein DFH11DRAFT_1797442 [Phellopilus nigrolimitatus]|nr:hypothetical protein DFH11DRAFT_1797442 [Phellopilus nigrolimitatus]